MRQEENVGPREGLLENEAIEEAGSVEVRMVGMVEMVETWPGPWLL